MRSRYDLLQQLFCLSLLGGCVGAPTPGGGLHPQSARSFATAIHTSFTTVTTAPRYVLITVVDANTGAERTGCITANFLAGAMSFESGKQDLFIETQGAEKAAMANTAHRFVFSNARALANLQFRYTADELALARVRLAPLTDDQLRDRHTFGAEGQLYDTQKTRSVRDATACALIDRGLSPGVADMTGGLYIAMP